MRNVQYSRAVADEDETRCWSEIAGMALTSKSGP